MRTIAIGLAMLIAASAANTALAEITYPWCRQAADGSVSCGFSSQQQCQDASVGKGAFCLQNPRYQQPAASSKSRRR
jgi:hypothetical protein